MADQISSFLASPRFLTKTLSDAETSVMSPTSILDAKLSSSSFINPFGHDSSFSSPSIKNNFSCIKSDSEAIGLALIDSIQEEEEAVNRMVLSGSKLKVQIPSLNAPPSPTSQSDFGIKTRNSHPFSGNEKRNCFTRQLSLKEMELCEDYTRVITHGPNPKTTHIFDDCIVESSCSAERSDDQITTGSNFLSFCHTCKRSLELGKDIYIYRGDKAFCSHECRFHEMIIERKKNPKSDESC